MKCFMGHGRGAHAETKFTGDRLISQWVVVAPKRQTPLTRRAVDPTSSARHPTLMWLHCEPCERRMDVGRDQSHKVALVAEARLPCQPAYGCSCVQHIV
ncbi:hypothetical protein TcWFU_000485 [Taenia crassiceps]|uniref:Uncharacterized protein n=1 Tax=Taenia crassiceps TaxID=6207 RepID=A0ABR4Q154_9CEST